MSEPTRTRRWARWAGVVCGLALAAGAGLTARSALAQQVEREVQVPLDPERGIVEMDARLRGELGIFPEVQGFESARLFRVGSGQHVLEIQYREQGALARERRPLSDAQLSALRTEIQDRLAAAGRERVVDRSGRPGLIVGQTAVGIGYHGWAVPAALDVESDRGAVATYLLVAGGSFLVPWIATRGASVSVGQRDAFFWGATRGILYGHTVGYVLAPDDQDDPLLGDDDQDEHVRLAIGSAGSVLGSLLGFYAARRFQADDGTVALWSTAADFGLAGAFGSAYALGLFDGEVVYECAEQAPCTAYRTGSDTDGYAVAAGLGVASLVGAKLWGDAGGYTVGDARALRSFGLLGAQALLPVASSLIDDSDPDQDRAMAAAAVAGGATGLFLGDRALRGTSLGDGDGLLVLAGHVAGGLAALGVTYLLDSGERGDETLYLATSAAGSAIGSLLTFRAVRSSAPQGSGAVDGPAMGRGSPAVAFHPEGAIAPFLGGRAREGAVRSTPLLTVRF